MNQNRLNEILSGFHKKRILVVGDYFLDKYLHLDARLTETSLETGLPAYQVTAVATNPGAASNVAANVISLGPRVTAVTIMGDDGEGYVLRRHLQDLDVACEGIIVSAERFTPTYTKPMMHEADGRVHELSRLDLKNRTVLPAELEEQVIRQLDQYVSQADGVIIADQVQERNCGVVSDHIRQKLCELAERHPEIPFVVDSRMRIGEYHHMYLKPNEREAYQALGKSVEGKISITDAGAAGKELSSRNGTTIFLTLGANGILVCANERVQRVPAVPVSGPIDIVGAGDSAIAGITCALSAGATPLEAALIGNLVASVTIRCIGTTGTASQEQVRAAFEEWSSGLR